MSRNFSDCSECGAPEGWCSCSDGAGLSLLIITKNTTLPKDGDQIIDVTPKTVETSGQNK